jgi:UDP-2-acetamido-2,6-beta-L-arabino-hexul-4-ose reductase
MPTLWIHHLRNIGTQPVTAFFWTNELFRPEDPDTFAVPVEQGSDLP